MVKPIDMEIARELRRRYEAGTSATKLAREYGWLTPRVVRYIRAAGGTIRNYATPRQIRGGGLVNWLDDPQ